VNRDRESAAIGDRQDPRALPALCLVHAGTSLLRWCEAPIDEGFLQIQIAFVVERATPHEVTLVHATLAQRLTPHLLPDSLARFMRWLLDSMVG
jgi:hypothetical protein